MKCSQLPAWCTGYGKCNLRDREDSLVSANVRRDIDGFNAARFAPAMCSSISLKAQPRQSCLSSPKDELTLNIPGYRSIVRSQRIWHTQASCGQGYSPLTTETQRICRGECYTRLVVTGSQDMRACTVVIHSWVPKVPCCRSK